MSPTLRTETFANHAVGPTLATAGFGLLVGDLTAVGAILRPDYATGPGVAFSLETLRNAALCARRGIVVRRPDVFERLARVNLIVIDDDPALSRLELEVTGVQTQLPEADLLRYAASTFRHLADDRASALIAACLDRRIHLLDLPPVDFRQGVTVAHDGRRIRVGEYLPAPDGTGPLVVEVDGTPAGLISFGRSTRPEAAAALRRIREVAPVPVALVSNRSEADAAALASLLGVDQYKGGFSPEDTARFLRACRRRGLRTAFIGNDRRRAGRRRGRRRRLVRGRARRRHARGRVAPPASARPVRRPLGDRPTPRGPGPRRPEVRPRTQRHLRRRCLPVRVHGPDGRDDQQPRNVRPVQSRHRLASRVGTGRPRTIASP